jgi:hypothetical protein
LAFSAGAAGGFSGTDIQPIKLGEFSAYSFDRRGPMMDWGELNVRTYFVELSDGRFGVITIFNTDVAEMPLIIKTLETISPT